MKKLQKLITVLLCLSMVIMCMSITVLASEDGDNPGAEDGIIIGDGPNINEGLMADTGVTDGDVENMSEGILLHGKYTGTVQNKGGLILGDTFSKIVDDGTGKYGLKLGLTNLTTDLTADADLYQYEQEEDKYAKMAYLTEFSFKLIADPTAGYVLPDTITIKKAGNTLTAGTDYTYDSQTGKVTIKENVVDAPLLLEAVGKRHEHVITNVPAKAATETEPGNIEYWYCDVCGKYFSDEALTTEISQESTVIPALGHNAVKVEAKEATETEPGNIEYWYCDICGKYFSDEALTTEISQESTVIPALGHNAVKVEAKEASCTEPGNKEYWHCERCGKYFSDEALTTEITLESTVIPALGHHAVKVEAKAATEKETGNIAYWYCDRCGKYFSDETLSKEISRESTVLPVLAHTHKYGTEWKADTVNHWHECSCGEKADAAAHTFGEWKITKEATTKEEGSREKVCTVCGYKVTESIPAVGTGTVIKTPKTNDSTNLTLWIVLLVVGAGGIIGTTVYLRKKRVK